MITCRELIDFIMDYLDDELSPADRAEFDRHLRVCPDCVNYLRMYTTTVQLGKAAFSDAAAPVPEEVPEQLIQAIIRSRGASTRKS